jgi:hypothetical protein
MSDFQNLLSSLLRGKKQKHPFSYESAVSSYKNDLQERILDFERRISDYIDKNNNKLTKSLRRILPSIVKNNKLIISSIDEYLNGNSGKAYDIFEKMMSYKIISNAIVNLRVELKDICVKPNYLYRVRVSDSQLTSRKEMFHIPFNMRHLVGSQRYSIAGLPCLYLGSSIYVCWQEMGKPNLDSLYISSYQLNAKNYEFPKYVLNFAFSLEIMKKNDIELLFFGSDDNDLSLDKQIAHLTLWPLLMACSYVKANEKAKFNIEYVIPNMLLQWIITDAPSVDGIIYLSTKTRQLRQSKIGMNVVIPPKSSAEKTDENEYCIDMAKCFELTNPISWQVLETISCKVTEGISDFGYGDDIEQMLLENYKSTSFYRAEKKIESILTLSTINNV